MILNVNINVILLSILLIIPLTNGASKFFIGTYSVIGQTTQNVAYPLNVCVNYKVELASLSPIAVNNLFGVYTCNEAGTVVTFTDYRTDTTCTDTQATNTNGATYTDNTIQAGELYSFTCDGEDNYGISVSCTKKEQDPAPTDGGKICCPEGCLYQTFATGVCVETPSGTYEMGECDATSGASYLYGSDASCSTANKGEQQFGAVIDFCEYFTTQFGSDMYRKMNDCYVNRNMISSDSYCPYVAPTPPTAPTLPTTSSPSMSPTTPTTRPSMAPSTPTTSPVPTTAVPQTNSVGFYCVHSLLLLVIAVAVYAM